MEPFGPFQEDEGVLEHSSPEWSILPGESCSRKRLSTLLSIENIKEKINGRRKQQRSSSVAILYFRTQADV